MGRAGRGGAESAAVAVAVAVAVGGIQCNPARGPFYACRHMALPRIAIVGRPNVGKSSLTNMIAGRRVSIVDPTPGVTRDRVGAVVDLPDPDPALPPVRVELTDTGGYGVYTAVGRRIDDAGHDLSALTKDIEAQIAAAVRDADLVLFVIDAQAGVTAQDELVATLLRRGGLAALGGRAGPGGGAAAPRVLVLANKVDGPRWEAHGAEGAALGFGQPVMVSAKNNYNRRHLVDTLHELAESIADRRRAESGHDGRQTELVLAIVGKRNAGKSTLVNTLAGAQRVIVSEIPGTTRDAVDVRFTIDGKTFTAIDTAGLRRRRSFQDRVEWYAMARMQEAVRRADVALLLIDATTPVSQVDQQLGHFIAGSYKPAAIVVNKWDLARGRPMRSGAGRAGKRGAVVTPEVYEAYLRQELKGLWYAPISFISARQGLNVPPTIDLAFELMEQTRARATTGQLNRMLARIVERRGPASKLGTFAKVYFAAQVSTAPPTIVCVVNKPELFDERYRRFLINRFRQELPFSEVPVRLIVRARKRGEDAATTAQRAASELDLSAGVQSLFDDPLAAISPPRAPDPGDLDPSDPDPGDPDGAILDAPADNDEHWHDDGDEALRADQAEADLETAQAPADGPAAKPSAPRPPRAPRAARSPSAARPPRATPAPAAAPRTARAPQAARKPAVTPVSPRPPRAARSPQATRSPSAARPARPARPARASQAAKRPAARRAAAEPRTETPRPRAAPARAKKSPRARPGAPATARKKAPPSAPGTPKRRSPKR